MCFDQVRGREQNRERLPAPAQPRQVRFMCEARLCGSSRGDDQDGRKPCVVASGCATVSIAVIGLELRGILAGSFGASVVLEEEAIPCAPATVNSESIRSAAATGTRRCTSPFDEGVVTSAARDCPTSLRESHKDSVGPHGVGEVPQPSPAVARSTAKQPVMTYGLR
jgi:hypothetical protein